LNYSEQSFSICSALLSLIIINKRWLKDSPERFFHIDNPPQVVVVAAG
jgi:hypothetical protein